MIYIIISILFSLFYPGYGQPTHGRIRSPYFPNNYPNNINYTWTILAPQHTNEIELVFKTFEIHRVRWRCYDYLKIKEAHTDFTPFKRCGIIPMGSVFVARDYKLVLTFVTDNVLNAKGFDTEWRVKSFKPTRKSASPTKVTSQPKTTTTTTKTKPTTKVKTTRKTTISTSKRSSITKETIPPKTTATTIKSQTIPIAKPANTQSNKPLYFPNASETLPKTTIMKSSRQIITTTSTKSTSEISDAQKYTSTNLNLSKPYIFYIGISVIVVLILLMLCLTAIAIAQRQVIIKLRREMLYTDVLPRSMELREQPQNSKYTCINTLAEINDQDSDGYTEPERTLGEYNNPESDYSSVLGQRPSDYEYTDVISGSLPLEEKKPTEYDYTEVICNVYSSVRRSEYLEPNQRIQDLNSKETSTIHL